MTKCQCVDSEPIEKEDGDLVCANCGMVLGVQQIVNTVAFEEGEGGSSRLLGTVVENGHNMAYDANLRMGGRSTYKEEMFKQAETKIRGACKSLKIAEHNVIGALRILRLVSNSNMTTGRSQDVTIAVCLYIACKENKSPHMLIDFSDHYKVNLFILGKFYQMAIKKLSIVHTILEPSLLIERYANMLDFGEHANQVVMTACRIVKRMKTDWISYGRRPSGICGAALILAGRTHGFHIKPNDIVGVVKIGSDTIKKRMKEFGRTDSSKLSIKEFMSINLEEAHDPPSFTDKKKLEDHELKEIEENSRQIQRDIQQLHVKKTTHEKKNKKRRHEEFIKKLLKCEDPNALADKFLKKGTELGSSYSACNSQIKSPEAAEDDAESRSKIMNCGLSDDMIGLGKSPKKKPDKQGQEGNGELDLTGIDDDEINQMIVPFDQIVQRTKAWEAKNPDHDERLEMRKKKNELEQQRKAKRKRRKPVDYTNSTSAAESLNMYQKTTRSKNVDYDVLKRITHPLDLPTEGGEQSHMKPVVEVEGSSLQPSSGASGQTVSSPQKQIVYNRKRTFAPRKIIGSPSPKKPRPSPPASTEESSPLKADKVEESEDDGVDVKQNDESFVRGNPLKEEIMDDIPDDDSDEEEEEEEDGLGLENYGVAEDEFEEEYY